MYDFMQHLFHAIVKRRTISQSVFDNMAVNVRNFNDEILLSISVCDENSTLYLFQGKGQTFKSAVLSALDTYYLNTELVGFKPKSVRLDIVEEVYPARESGPFVDIQADKISYVEGFDGLAIGNSLEILFLPEEVTIHKLIINQKLQIANMIDAYKDHSPHSTDEKFTHVSQDSPIMEVYKIRTTAYYADKDGPILLFRGHRLFPIVGKDEILTAITLTKDYYFKHVLNKKGKYIYSFLPRENQKEKRYNILRHAGTTYSILETYELLPDKELLKIAESALKFLLGEVASFEINGHSVNVVIEKDVIKLGGNALSIIALAKYTQITGNHQYIPLMQRMATWMREIQNEEGQFTVHKQQFSTREIYDFTSQYYPGEAMLSLIRLYQIDGNKSWLDIAERSARYLIQIRDKDADISTIAHDHWLLYALNELYRERPKTLYLSHALLLSKAIMQSQISSYDKNVDENGAYCLPHPRFESTPTACRSEGLCATYHLARDYGYAIEASKMKTAIEEGIRFQLQTQLRPESVMFYENKNLCLGSFQRGLMKYDLRIDYTQHNISSLIAYYRILSIKS